MRTNSKKALSVMFAATAAMCLSLGVAFQNNDGIVNASATTTASVNAIGVLKWDETENAVSYEISSTYGTFTTDETQANVGEWITQAAKAASEADSASITFNVTPIMSDESRGTTVEYTHTFTEYIDYGYSTLDLADVYAPAKEGVRTAKSSYGGAASAVYKNNLLTYGVTFEATVISTTSTQVIDLTNGARFYFFTADPTKHPRTDTTHVWRLVDFGATCRIYAAGTMLYSQKLGVAVADGDTCVYSVGVFDTYGLNGVKAGETFYMCREKVETNGAKTLQSENYVFVNNNTLADPNGDEDLSDAVTEDSYSTISGASAMASTKVDIAGFSWEVYRTPWTVHSGKVDAILNKPDMLYYDNTNETVVWNSVDGATAYEWAYGNNAWQTTYNTCVSVGDLLDTYQTNYATTGVNYLPIRVRAVNAETTSETAYYNVNFKTFFNKTTTSLDISEGRDICRSADSTWTPASTQIYFQNWSLNNFGVGTLTETSFIWKEGSDSRTFYFGLFGDNDDMYYPYYSLALTREGHLEFSRGIHSKEDYQCWRTAELGALSTNVRYYLRYGVDEVYADGVQVAERITIVISKDDGFARETIYIGSYDNLQYADTDVAIDKTGSYVKLGFGYLNNNSAATNYVDIATSMPDDTTTNLIIQADGNEDFTKAIVYGSRFDMTSVIAEYEQTNGCKVTALKYSTDGGETYSNELPTYGIWNEETDLTVQAEVEPFYKDMQLSISLNGDIGVNLYVNFSDYVKENLDGATMKITFKGESSYQEIPTPQATGEYKFSYAVAAKEIDTPITAQLVLANGMQGKEITYCVRDYVNLVTEGDEEYEVATALAKYCDAAKEYFNDTAQPALDETEVDFNAFAPTVNDVEDNVTLYGISLIAESKTTLRLYFRLESDEMPTTIQVNGADVTPTQSGDFYYVDMEDIHARNLQTNYTFAIGENTVSCSALSYGCLVQNDDNKSVNLVKALYAYSEAAKAYFGTDGGNA